MKMNLLAIACVLLREANELPPGGTLEDGYRFALKSDWDFAETFCPPSESAI